MKRKQVDSATLAKRWNMDKKKTLKIVKLTTQRGVRITLHPFFSCWYPTNDCMMCYKRLPQPVFSDILKAGVLAKQGNKHVQAHCTQYGWSQCHTTKLKLEANESLPMHFKHDGLPPKIVINNSWEKS